MNEASFLSVRNLVKDYEGGRVRALRGVSFELGAGEVVALTGPSGCGKSTLLSLIGLLDRPTSGEIQLGETDLATVKDRFAYRACSVGFVFQFHHLLPAMTLQENVEAPMIARGLPRRERREKAAELLTQMGLSHRSGFLPNKVSGGERQRAAVARALVNGPRLLLADEPTGNLDSTNGRRVMDLFVSYARNHGVAVLLATHNPEISAWADRTIEMRDGSIVAPNPAQARPA